MQTNKVEDLQNHRWQQICIISLAIATIFGLIIVLQEYLAIGVDFYFDYRPFSLKWLHGEIQLYDSNRMEPPVYYNAPWTLFLTLPLSLFSFKVGLAILNTLSLSIIALTIHIWRSNEYTIPIPVLFLSLFNPHTIDLFVRGQIDAFILIGVVIGWWATNARRPLWLALAFALLAMKPLNVILVSLLFLITIRHWTWSERLMTLSVPTVLVLISPLLFGLDWPLRYIEYIRVDPPWDGIEITIWKGLELAGLPNWPFIPLALVAVATFVWWGWQIGATRWMVCVALATNLVFTTYATGNHYILLVPVFIYLAWQDWRLVILAYLFMWTPFSRFKWSDTSSWLDIFYAILLLITSWYFGLRSHCSVVRSQLNTASSLSKASYQVSQQTT